ncbi:hypothetical protein ACROYT_G006563 [Oculina patagonica]
MPVRLRGSHSPGIGRVEVYYAGKWGSIHAAYWDINEATVVCRQLGYLAASLSGYRLFCSAAVAHWFVWFNCNGNESSLDQCPRHFNDYYSYYGYYDGYCASVVCKDKTADSGLEVRLRGSPVPHAGRVELRFKGVWGTIGCVYYPADQRHIDPELARVVCRQLNFTDGILATGWSVFGPGTGPQWFYNYELKCLENESNLLNCSQHEPHMTRQGSYSDLSVVCKPDVPQTSGFQVRLSGSSLPFAGTIEVMYHGVWGSVLGDGIDINVGHVVCRQLGYSGANKIFNRAAFGRVKGPMWIWKIQCIGNEAEISHCAVTTWDNITQSLYESYFRLPLYAAGVLCNEANSSASKSVKVRLAGAPIRNAGRVEVFYAGVWGTVSRGGWDIKDAHVVCRQLGYPGATLHGYSHQFGDGSGPLWFVNVGCIGYETNFGECFKDVYGYPTRVAAGKTATALCNQTGKKK